MCLRVGVRRIHETPWVGDFADQRTGMPTTLHGQLVDGHGAAHGQRLAPAAQQKRVHPGSRVHPLQSLTHTTEQAVGRLNGLDVLWHTFRRPLQGGTGHYRRTAITIAQPQKEAHQSRHQTRQHALGAATRRDSTARPEALSGWAGLQCAVMTSGFRPSWIPRRRRLLPRPSRRPSPFRWPS